MKWTFASHLRALEDRMYCPIDGNRKIRPMSRTNHLEGLAPLFISLLRKASHHFLHLICLWVRDERAPQRKGKRANELFLNHSVERVHPLI